MSKNDLNEDDETNVNLGQWIGLLSLTIALYGVWQIRQLLLFIAVALATHSINLLRALKGGVKEVLFKDVLYHWHKSWHKAPAYE